MVPGHDIAGIRQALGERSVVLVGMMGAGKSSIGKQLASRLRLGFVDSDRAIEQAAQRSVAEIFEGYGEAAFRDCERRVIARVLTSPAQVVALGGGAWNNAETRMAVTAKGISVWLDADVAVLLERVRRRASRPLLQVADPAKVLADLADERRPIYALANIHLKVGNRPHSHVIDDVMRALSSYLGIGRRDAG